jgi:hypothetical protein
MCPKYTIYFSFQNITDGVNSLGFLCLLPYIHYTHDHLSLSLFWDRDLSFEGILSLIWTRGECDEFYEVQLNYWFRPAKSPSPVVYF